MHLIQDESFDYELIRVMAHTTYRGSDTLEVIQLLSKIKPGDMESWYEAFFDLAQRVEASVGSAPSAPSPSRAVSRADRLFAASNYYRAADFFLHGNGEDPRITSIWKKQTECYDLALQALGNGQRFTLDADEFNVPIIYFKASAHSKEPCPTIIVGNGYDGAMEEMLHVNGFAALERGYNVILYEGPGQPTVRREQDLGFIPDWERVVKPVVDFAVEQPEVNTKKIALFGYSFGGILSVRAAAFEHRLAAAIAVDGLFNFAPPMPGHVSALYRDGDREAFDETLASMATNPKVPTGLRWGIEQGLWSFKSPTPSDFMDKAATFDLTSVIESVQCPVFVGDAEEDIFFKGQPERVANALGSKAHYREFKTAEAAGLHCQVGAASLLNAETFDWLERVLR